MAKLTMQDAPKFKKVNGEQVRLTAKEQQEIVEERNRNLEKRANRQPPITMKDIINTLEAEFPGFKDKLLQAANLRDASS